MSESSITSACVEPSAGSIDRFSWRRVGMVARYWWPRLRSEFFIFLGISVITASAGSLMVTVSENIYGSSLASLASFLAIGGAAVFGTKNGRDIDISLPASNAEKMAFYLIYSLLVIPLITFVASTLIYMAMAQGDACRIGMKMLTAEGFEEFMSPRFKSLSTWSGYTTVFAIIMITLYSAVFIRRNAVVKSLCVAFGSYFIPTFTGGIYGGLLAFHTGYEAAMNGTEIDEKSLVRAVMEDMDIFLVSLGSLFSVLFLLFLWLFIRNYPRRQG